MSDTDLCRRFVKENERIADALSIDSGRRYVDNIAKVNYFNGVVEGMRRSTLLMQEMIARANKET